MALLKAFVVAVVIVIQAAAPADAGVDVGDQMPVVSAVDSSGAAVDIDVTKAGVVAVEFWASWCKACRETLPALAQLAKERCADGFRAIIVNIDQSRGPADQYLSKDLAGYSEMLNVYDPGGQAMARLGSAGLPALYVVEDGTVRLAQAGWQAGGVQRLRKVVDTLLRRRRQPPHGVDTAAPGDESPG